MIFFHVYFRLPILNVLFSLLFFLASNLALFMSVSLFISCVGQNKIELSKHGKIQKYKIDYFMEFICVTFLVDNDSLVTRSPERKEHLLTTLKEKMDTEIETLLKGTKEYVEKIQLIIKILFFIFK